jgi:hypothetical protein
LRSHILFSHANGLHDGRLHVKRLNQLNKGQVLAVKALRVAELWMGNDLTNYFDLSSILEAVLAIIRGGRSAKGNPSLRILVAVKYKSITFTF